MFLPTCTHYRTKDGQHRVCKHVLACADPSSGGLRNLRLHVDIVARALTLSSVPIRCLRGPAQVCMQAPSVDASGCVRALTFVFGKQHRRLYANIVTHPHCICARSSQGIKGLHFSRTPHFASTQSFLAWIYLPTTPCKNLTDGILAFRCDCVTISLNCIATPLTTFIFYITRVDNTFIASGTNGKMEKGD